MIRFKVTAEQRVQLFLIHQGSAILTLIINIPLQLDFKEADKIGIEDESQMNQTKVRIEDENHFLTNSVQ